MIVDQHRRERSAEPLFQFAGGLHGRQRIEAVAGQRLARVEVVGRHAELAGDPVDQARTEPRRRSGRPWPRRPATPVPVVRHPQGRCHEPITSSVPARYPALQAWRWILPLDVFGMLPGLSRTTASTGTSWASTTARLTAAATSAGDAVRPLRSTSET